MTDLFDNTDNQLIVDFIKDINFYHLPSIITFVYNIGWLYVSLKLKF